MVGPLEGRAVAVTGAARGIGLATARVLRSRGARVALGDIDEEEVSAAARQLGRDTFSSRLDVTDHGSFASFLGRAEEVLGPLDVLVNNAGIMPVGPVTQEPEEIARRTFDVNVHGVITGTKLALERMLPRGRGHIVNIASLAGLVPSAGIATYCGSKHAVVGFHEAVRLEHRDAGVEFTLVLPAFVETELTSGTRGLPGIATLLPGDVATAIADAVVEPRPQVTLPRSVFPIVRFGSLLPRRARESLGRMFRLDRVFFEVDDEARRAYDERVGVR